MIRIIEYDDWYEIYDDENLFYEGHNMNDALEAYLEHHSIPVVREQGEEE